MMKSWVEQKSRVIRRMPRGEMAQYIPRGASFANDDMSSWISRVDSAPLPPNSLSTIRIVPHVGLADQNIKVMGIAALKIAVTRARIVCPYVSPCRSHVWLFICLLIAFVAVFLFFRSQISSFFKLCVTQDVEWDVAR